MRMTIQKDIVGDLNTLMSQARTGDIIHYGVHSADAFRAGPRGPYIRRGHQFFEILGPDSVHRLGDHPCDSWGVGRDGIVYRRDSSMYQILSNGSVEKIVVNGVKDWNVGHLGVCVRDGKDFFVRDNDGNFISYGKHSRMGWGVGQHELYLRRDVPNSRHAEFFTVTPTAEHSLGIHAYYGVWCSGPLGIVIPRNRQIVVLDNTGHEHYVACLDFVKLSVGENGIVCQLRNGELVMVMYK